MESTTPGMLLIFGRNETGMGWVMETRWCVTRRSASAGADSGSRNSERYAAAKTLSRQSETATLPTVRRLLRGFRTVLATINDQSRNIVLVPIPMRRHARPSFLRHSVPLRVLLFPPPVLRRRHQPDPHRIDNQLSAFVNTDRLHNVCAMHSHRVH